VFAPGVVGGAHPAPPPLMDAATTRERASVCAGQR